jgi:hypothetical protein
VNERERILTSFLILYLTSGTIFFLIGAYWFLRFLLP